MLKIEANTWDKVVELEGLKYQLRVITGPGEDDQLEMLNSAVTESGCIKEDLEILIDARGKGNPELTAEDLALTRFIRRDWRTPSAAA